MSVDKVVSVLDVDLTVSLEPWNIDYYYYYYFSMAMSLPKTSVKADLQNWIPTILYSKLSNQDLNNEF